jgi:hypothetical protein
MICIGLSFFCFGYEKIHIHGGGKQYPVYSIGLLVFRVMIFGKAAQNLHLETLTALAGKRDYILRSRVDADAHKQARIQNRRDDEINRLESDIKRLLKDCELTQSELSKAKQENRTLRSAIKIMHSTAGDEGEA